MPGGILSVSAPAKINLYLKITGRREDGYHLLATLMQKIGLNDTLVLRKKGTGIRLQCTGSELPVDKSNIVWRAARLFFDALWERIPDGRRSGIDILLNKVIPVAAGLGGGSSDAAATLRGMNQLYGRPCTDEELLSMASCLGADVPQFIVDWPVVWATGIGDRLHPAVPLQDFKILLVNPGISVSTRWIYEKYALTVGKNIYNLKSSQIKSIATNGESSVFAARSILPSELENDLEKITAGQYGIINELKMRLLKGGASAAMMSGSGPTVFGLFPADRQRQGEICCEELKKEFAGTFLVDPLR